MTTDFDRAMVLYRQSRFDLAERFFRGFLAVDPKSWLAHAYIAYCLAEQRRTKQAVEEGREAVRLAPEAAFAYYVLAKALFQAKTLTAAQRAIDEAIRLDPSRVCYFSLKAAILFDRRRRRAALACAQSGLRIASCMRVPRGQILLHFPGPRAAAPILAGRWVMVTGKATGWPR